MTPDEFFNKYKDKSPSFWGVQDNDPDILYWCMVFSQSYKYDKTLAADYLSTEPCCGSSRDHATTVLYNEYRKC